MRETETTIYLFLIVHGDLDEHHGVGQAPQLLIPSYGLPPVALLRRPVEQLHAEAHGAHVHGLQH